MSFYKGHKKNMVGAKHHLWKGDSVSYRNLHQWVKRWLGVPEFCSNCKEKGGKNKGRWTIHWANKSGHYARNLNDYLALCVPCHRKYDAESYKNTKRKYYYNVWQKKVLPLKKYA